MVVVIGRVLDLMLIALLQKDHINWSNSNNFNQRAYGKLNSKQKSFKFALVLVWLFHLMQKKILFSNFGIDFPNYFAQWYQFFQIQWINYCEFRLNLVKCSFSEINSLNNQTPLQSIFCRFFFVSRINSILLCLLVLSF